jgi:hypothetical protein
MGRWLQPVRECGLALSKEGICAESPGHHDLVGDVDLAKLSPFNKLLSVIPQAPGGQVLRLVGINEDLSKYEGDGEGPNITGRDL